MRRMRISVKPNLAPRAPAADVKKNLGAPKRSRSISESKEGLSKHSSGARSPRVPTTPKMENAPNFPVTPDKESEISLEKTPEKTDGPKVLPSGPLQTITRRKKLKPAPKMVSNRKSTTTKIAEKTDQDNLLSLTTLASEADTVKSSTILTVNEKQDTASETSVELLTEGGPDKIEKDTSTEQGSEKANEAKKQPPRRRIMKTKPNMGLLNIAKKR